MLTLVGEFAKGIRTLIAQHQLRGLDAELEHLIHLGLLNRGVMITPFHDMMLVCPQTTAADVDRLLNALGEVLKEIVAEG